MPKIPGGYYLKARKIQESKIAHAPPHIREIWDWLLKEANHKDKKYCGFIVKRGQLFRTYKNIRDGLHWMIGYRKMMYNENHTKKAMKFLRENQMIVTSKELGGVLITILNYDIYQNPKNYERTNDITIERTNEEPMKNHPLPYTNKNEKNETHTKDTVLVYEFYISEISPERKSKKRALKNISKWLKKHSKEDLFQAINNYQTICGDNPTYKKDPANFFGIKEPFHIDYIKGNFEPPREAKCKTPVWL